MKYNKKYRYWIISLLVMLFVFIPTEKSNAHTNGHTQQEGVDWACARGNEAWCYDMDGAYGCQCVDLILAYYDYLYGERRSGNAIDYSWNPLPQGWTRVYSNPQPGDIIVWQKGAPMWWNSSYVESYANSEFGHIGIIIRNNPDGSITTIETNAKQGRHAAYYQRYATYAACFIRPNFVPANITTYSGNKITLDANGGTLKGARTSSNLTGYDRPRPENSLIVYTKSGKMVPTNEWGVEAAVDKNGRVIQIRPYLSNVQLTVPSGGMVLSGHSALAPFVEQLKVGDYVYCDYSNKKVYVFDSQEAYLAQGKYVNSGAKYGTLPSPTRNGYAFQGWYTQASGGRKITESSYYSVSKLYAQWKKLSSKKAQSITADNHSKTIGNASFYVKAKLKNGDGKLSYASGNKSVVTVSGSGKVTIKGVGKTTITITAAETSKYAKATKKITVTVKPKKTSITGLKSSSVGTATVNWKKGSSISGYQIQYSQKSDFSKAEKITVSNNKTNVKITDVSGGKKYYVRIRTYKTVDGEKIYSSWSSKKCVTVKGTQKITAENFNKTLGDSAFYIKAKRTIGNGKLSYTSGNKAVATVSGSGKVTIKGIGKTTITITAAETTGYAKTTKKITVNVKPKKITLSGVKSSTAEMLTVNWKKSSGISGYQVQFSKKSDFSKAEKITLPQDINSVKIKNLTGGDTYYVRIRAYKTVGGEIIYSSWSSKKNTVVKRDTTKGSLSLSGSASGSNTCTLKAKTYPSDAKVTWVTSNAAVATVSDGKVTAKGAGSAIITAKITYKNKTYTASKKVTVGAVKSYGAWSSWSMTPAYASDSMEVRMAPLYRYYCFYCPVCGGREPFSGNSDCYQYTLDGGDWQEIWSPIAYSQCNGSQWPLASNKMYTTSLGDGQIWNFGTANLYDTACGTMDSGSGAVVIQQGYSTRSIRTSYVISNVE